MNCTVILLVEIDLEMVKKETFQKTDHIKLKNYQSKHFLNKQIEKLIKINKMKSSAMSILLGVM